MLKLIVVILGALLTCAASAAPLGAQAEEARSVSRRGWHVGLDPLVYGTLTSEYVTGGRTVGGMGLQIRAGWTFSDKLSLAMDVSVTDLAVADSAKYLLSNGDILLRYTPFTFVYGRRTIVPYLGLGVGLRDISAEGRSPTGTGIYGLSGEVLAFSAGASVYLRENLSVLLAYHGGAGDFNDERVGNVTTHNRKQFGESHRVALGLTVHARRRR